jgi:hypothetical protein
MNDPILKLMKLNSITRDLDKTQILIDRARKINLMDQHYQLELDRAQSDVDAKRVFIAQVMADIRNRN